MSGSPFGILEFFGAKEQSASAEKSTRMQVDSQNSANAILMEYLRETRADIADAVEKGVIDLETGYNLAIKEMGGAGDAIGNYAALMMDPNAVMKRPGVQFQYKQGLDALQAAFSKTSGGGLTGKSMKAAMEYGQNFASMALDAELARYGPLITAQTNRANLMTGKGTALANLRVGGAAGIAGATGGMTQAVAGGVANLGNIGAAGQVNQANILTNFLNSMNQKGADVGGYMQYNNLFRSNQPNSTPAPTYGGTESYNAYYDFANAGM